MWEGDNDKGSRLNFRRKVKAQNLSFALAIQEYVKTAGRIPSPKAIFNEFCIVTVRVLNSYDEIYFLTCRLRNVNGNRKPENGGNRYDIQK